MTTPDLIRTRRQALKLTQKALGLKCGYKATTAEQVVQNWEYGKQPVPMARIRALAAALEISVDSLIPYIPCHGTSPHHPGSGRSAQREPHHRHQAHGEGGGG